MSRYKNSIINTLESSAPLYLRLRDQIREQIYSHELERGQRVPTEAELARQYQVSNITVRRAMQELVNEGLLVRTPGKGTFVNPSPFTATYNLLFVHSLQLSFEYPFTGLIFKGICEVNQPTIQFRLETLGLPPRAVQHGEDQRVLELIEHDLIHGVLALPFMKPETIEQIASRTPVVMLGSILKSELPTISTIVYPMRNDVLDVSLAYLSESGHHKIGYVTEPKQNWPNPQSDLPSMFQKYGLPFDWDRMKPAAWGIDGGRNATHELLDADSTLDAIVTADDLQALGAMHAAWERGLKPGKDLAIIGSGNLLEEHSNAGLTTVDNQVKRGAELGTQNLLKMLQGEEVAPLVRMEPKLIIRETA